MQEKLVNIDEHLCELQMSGYFNNTCRTENLLINSRGENYQENYIEKYSEYKNNLSYPARASDQNDEYRCVYPEAGLNSEFPNTMIAGELRYENFLNDLISKADGKIHLIVGHGNIVGLLPKVFYEESKDNYEMYQVNYTCLSIYGRNAKFDAKKPAPAKKGYEIKHGWHEVMISYGEHVGYPNCDLEWIMDNLKLRPAPAKKEETKKELQIPNGKKAVARK